jgi:RNA polymerase sigma-70 factor (ECF subfamily)
LIYKKKTKKEISKLERLKQEALLDFVEFSIEEIENIYKQIDIEIEKLPTQCREVFSQVKGGFKIQRNS